MTFEFHPLILSLLYSIFSVICIVSALEALPNLPAGQLNSLHRFVVSPPQKTA